MSVTRATTTRLEELRKAIRHHGLTLAAKQFMDSQLGVVSYVKIKVPFLDSTVVVRTNTFWKYFEEETWERRCIKCMIDVVKQGDVLLDIGAWLGPYTILFSKLVGPQGFVYSFEPDPVAFLHLQDNVSRNQLSNVLAENTALADRGGSLALVSARLGGSMTSTIRTGSIARNQFVTKATTIDAYCKLNRIHPKGIKLDVEGCEGSVIRGGLEVLQECHPWLLLEFHGFLMADVARTDNWRLIADRARRIVPLEDGPPAPDYGHFFVEF